MIDKHTIKLEPIKRSDPRILADMATHYSKPGGFVGRSICYAIVAGDIYYGAIVGGSSTLHLIGRDKFFGLTKQTKKAALKTIVNNIFYHIEKKNNKYPIRNCVPKVLKMFREQIAKDWLAKYGDSVIGFESLIELPRTGEAYKRDGWIEVGITKGQTCKRVAGKGTDSWTGKRVWDTKNLRPKRVFVRLASNSWCSRCRADSCVHGSCSDWTCAFACLLCTDVPLMSNSIPTLGVKMTLTAEGIRETVRQIR